MRARWTTITVALALAGLFGLAPAWGQTTTGAIRGSVVDAEGGGLPGVQVTVSGPALLRPRSVVTGPNGDFNVPALPVGVYTVEASLASFAPARAENVRVLLGGTAAVRLQMRLESMQAEMLVTGDAAPLVDPTDTGTGGRVTYEELLSVPTARDPWAVLSLVPGIQTDRVNVGGTLSGQQSQFAAKGDSGANTMWNIDGVTVTDMAAVGSSSLYYDFGSIEEIQVTTGGNDASMTTGGIGINIVTKRGSNELHGSARGLFTNDDLQADNLPDIFKEGGELAHRRVRANTINQIIEVGGEAGGPIVRDRVWLWGAINRNEIKTFAAAFSDEFPGGFPDDTTLENYSGKLNLQITDSNEGNVFFTYADKIKLGRNADRTRPPETTFNQSGPSPVLKVEDQQLFGSDTLLALKGAWVGGGFKLKPQGGSDVRGVPESTVRWTTLDFGTGIWSNNFYDYDTTRPQYLFQADGSHFRSTGSIDHDFKFGFSYRDTPIETTLNWDGGGWLGAVGPDTYLAFVHPPHQWNYEFKMIGAYLNDTLTSGNLTVDLGLRFDRSQGSLNETLRPAHPIFPNVFPAINYAGSDGALITWNTFSPRLGLSYQLGEKALVKANYALYADQLGGGDIAGFSPVYYHYGYLYFTDLNQNARPDPGTDSFFLFPGGPDCGNQPCFLGFDGFDPSDPFGAVTLNRIEDGYSSPKTHEVILGTTYQIARDSSIGLNFTWRQRNNTTWRVPLVFDPVTGAERQLRFSDWVHGASFSIDPGPNFDGDFDLPAVQYERWQLAPGVTRTFGVEYANRPEYYQRFLGLEAVLQKRFSNRWSFYASLALNDWTEHFTDVDNPLEALRAGNGNQVVSSFNPNRLVGNALENGGPVAPGSGTGSGAFGQVFLNSKWQSNVRGTYAIPVIDVDLGASLQLRQGYPSPIFARTSTPRALGSTANLLLGGIDELRMKDLFMLDLRLGKDFSFSDSIGLELSADVFNVTNNDIVMQHLRSATTTTYLLPTEFLGARTLRLSARVKF
jgi:hypothetical protein